MSFRKAFKLFSSGFSGTLTATPSRTVSPIIFRESFPFRISDLSADEIVEFYSRRFTIEESFRDDKDDRFGLGLKEATIGDPKRRDRLLLLLAIARVLLTNLGAAGEQIGLQRTFRSFPRTPFAAIGAMDRVCSSQSQLEK